MSTVKPGGSGVIEVGDGPLFLFGSVERLFRLVRQIFSNLFRDGKPKCAHFSVLTGKLIP